MKILEKSDATGSLAEYTANIEKEPVIVTSDGIPIAALVPIGNVDLETMSLSTNAAFIALIRAFASSSSHRRGHIERRDAASIGRGSTRVRQNGSPRTLSSTFVDDSDPLTPTLSRREREKRRCLSRRDRDFGDVPVISNMFG